MKYISDKDSAYLRQKYHTDDGSHNNFGRFICYDGRYDMSTGFDAKTMREKLSEYIGTITDTHHSVIKAKAVAYVLEHTPIDLNPCDYFPGIHSLNRVVQGLLNSKWNSEVFGKLLPSDVSKTMNLLSRDGAVTIWPDYDHSVPDWDYMLPIGFPGLLENAMKAKADKTARDGELTEAEKGFYDSIEIVLNGVLRLLDRLIAYGEAHESENEKSGTVLPALRRLRCDAPRTVYEVLLFIYLYFIISEHIEVLQVRSLSNLDRVLQPYYIEDRLSGRYEDEDIRTFLAYFLMQFQAIDNYWGQPVYLGGTNDDGTTKICDMSYMILDVYDELGIWNPKIQLKYSEGTPKTFVNKALDMIRRNHNSIVFVSEDFVEKALTSKGFTLSEARAADIKGCYEFSPAQTVGSTGTHINLAKPIEYAFFEGTDPNTGNFCGISMGKLEDFDTFDKFLDACIGYAKYFFDESYRCTQQYENYYDYVNPQPLFSSTYRSALEKGQDAYCRGAKAYSTCALLCSIGTAADSLAMVKKYCYDTGEVPLSEMKKALAANFEGYETLRLKLLNDKDKYGNDREMPDSIAEKYTTALGSYIKGRPCGNCRPNGFWSASLHNARQYIDQGRKTGATPDGRRRGEEMSKNASPSQGAGAGGATGAILSQTKLNGQLFSGDFPLDVSLHPSAVRGEEGLNAMRSLLEVWRIRGGHAIHFNIFDARTLRAAQAEPEKYQDLQIRVCGWNALFNSMDRAEQNQYIRQAEAYQ